MNLTAFGNCMKRNREKHNITLDDLAQRTGLCKELLQAFEDGTQKPKASELKKISREINIPLLILKRGGGTVGFRGIGKDGKPVCDWREY